MDSRTCRRCAKTARLGLGAGKLALPTLAVLALSFAGCTSNQNPAPLLQEVDPAVVWDQIPTPATIHGAHLYQEAASIDLGESGVNTEEGSFEVSLDGTAMAEESYQWIDSKTLDFVIPAGLTLGPHSLSVRVQDGRMTTLDNAFTVVDMAVPHCGDGSCNGSEDAVSCPEDCVLPVCGDGACNGTEDPISCPADCASCANCAGGTCSDVCTDSCIYPTCADPCFCSYDCTMATGNCEVDCRSACSVNCEGATDCQVECREDAVCKMDCQDSSDCDLRCRENATCSMDCIGANCDAVLCDDDSLCNLNCADALSCDSVQCNGNAQCLINCTGAVSCAFDNCHGTELSCPGNIIVCGMPCP